MKILERIERWAKRRCCRIALESLCATRIWLKYYHYEEEAEALGKPLTELAQEIERLS